MKSILKVKIIGIDYHTMERVSLVKSITCDDLNFTDKVLPPVKINNGKLQIPATILTANQQADEWLSKQSSLLNSFIYDSRHELKCILNWEILSITNIGLNNLKSTTLASTPKKVKISDFEKIKIIFTEFEKMNGEFSEDFKNTFLHVYQEMRDVLHGINIDKKIRIILSAMNIGAMAATTAYEKICELYNSFDNDALMLNKKHN